MRYVPYLVLALLAGCGVTLEDPDDTNGKADGNGTCTDPKYGDGTCQVDLGCGIPDIDCFVTFATDAEAATWAAARYPMASLPETDPQFARARKALDRAWELYTADVPLGKLADKRPGLVLIDDATINAFAMPDGAPGMAGLSVQINRGLMASSLTDDEVVGVLLHELTHIVRLHVLDEVADHTRRFYVAAKPEQLGASAPEVSHAREAGLAWRTDARLVGMVTDPALGSLPFGGLLDSLLYNYSAACTAELEDARNATSVLGIDWLIQGYEIPPGFAQTAGPAHAALLTCAQHAQDASLRTFLDQAGADWGAALAPFLTGDDAALDDRPALSAILELLGKHRAAMHALETGFPATAGAPWSSLRFFSIEEEADDYAARISAHHKLATDGAAGACKALLAGKADVCEAQITAGTVSYGQMLDDDHHADCWRIMHSRQVAKSAPATATARTAPPVTWTPTRRQVPRPIY